MTLENMLEMIEKGEEESQATSVKSLLEIQADEQLYYGSQQLDLQIPTEDFSQLNLAEESQQSQQTAQIQQNYPPKQ